MASAWFSGCSSRHCYNFFLFNFAWTSGLFIELYLKTMPVLFPDSENTLVVLGDGRRLWQTSESRAVLNKNILSTYWRMEGKWMLAADYLPPGRLPLFRSEDPIIMMWWHFSAVTSWPGKYHSRLKIKYAHYDCETINIQDYLRAITVPDAFKKNYENRGEPEALRVLLISKLVSSAAFI